MINSIVVEYGNYRAHDELGVVALMSITQAYMLVLCVIKIFHHDHNYENRKKDQGTNTIDLSVEYHDHDINTVNA